MIEMDWQVRAACRTEPIEHFYSAEPEAVRAAIGLCRRCPVRMTCLEAAVSRGEWFGVWGGTTERERRRMIRARHSEEDAA